MPARDPNLRMEASKWAETPEDRAYYETLNDDQLRSILVGLAASKGEREIPVDAPANLKARASSSMRPASSDQFTPESPTSARRMLEGPERAAKGLAAGAGAAAFPASMAISGPVAPSIMGLFAATEAGKGLGNVAEGNYGKGAGQLALAGLPYTGRLASLLRVDPEAAFIQKMRTEGAPRPYGPSRGVDVPYRGPSGVDIPSDVEGVVERGTQRGLRNATKARQYANEGERISKVESIWKREPPPTLEPLPPLPEANLPPDLAIDLKTANKPRMGNTGPSDRRMAELYKHFRPDAASESMQGLNQAGGSMTQELPTSWEPYVRSQSVPTVEGRMGRATAAMRDAKALQPQSRSSLRPRGYKPRENGPLASKSRYDKK